MLICIFRALVECVSTKMLCNLIVVVFRVKRDRLQYFSLLVTWQQM